MANITKRISKDGVVSYRVRAYAGTGPKGKKILRSMTYTPSAGIRPTSAEKEVQKQAALFERRVQSGMSGFGDNATFSEYAKAYIESEPLTPKTKDSYTMLTKRIVPAIGHIRLGKLKAQHLEAFYKNLQEPGIKELGKSMRSDKLNGLMKERKITRGSLAKAADLCTNTVSLAANGKPISINSAMTISKALDEDYKNLFSQVEDSAELSEKTILHYHQFIRAVLSKAKRERIIPVNVAAEQVTAPKVHKKEILYFDDVQARRFLSVLDAEKDVRIKSAFYVMLFTGVRRGELCGLRWDDVDMDKNIIHVRRASQYLPKQGVHEVPTKTGASIRDISVPINVINVLREYRKWWVERRFSYAEDWKGQLDHLFIQEDGKPINPDTINLWLDRLLKTSDLPHITPHGLRHTFATLQITSGVDIRTLQARTGHAQASTLTDIYSHAIQSAQQAASDSLADVLLPKKA